MTKRRTRRTPRLSSRVQENLKLHRQRQGTARTIAILRGEPVPELPKPAPKPKRYRRRLTKEDKMALAADALTERDAQALGERHGIPASAARSLLRNDPIVRSYIVEKTEEKMAEAEITLEELLRELKRVALANMAHYSARQGSQLVGDFSKTTYAQMAAVSELQWDEDEEGRIKSKVKLHAKNAALDMLCKYFKLYMEGTLPGGNGQAAQPPALHVTFVEAKK